MEYMITIHSDHTVEGPQPGTPEFDQMMAGWMALNQQLIAGGHFIAGASLAPPFTATTLRRTLGAEPTVTDGPFAETKEQLGGFYLVKAEDLDEALELARSIPIPAGTIEIRPVGFRPDAEGAIG